MTESFLTPHALLKFYLCFDSPGRIFQNIRIRDNSAPLCHENDSGASEGKVSFFFSSLYHSPAGMVFDLPDQHRPYFHLKHGSEVFGTEKAVFSCILFINGVSVIGNRIDRMIYAWNADIPGCFSTIYINITMIVIYTKPENPDVSSCIFFCQFSVFLSES